MKRFLFAIVVPASLIFFGCSNSGNGDAITLKFNLPQGSSYDYDMDMNMSMKGNANGQQVNMTNKMKIGYRFGVTGDSAEWKKLTANITRIAMDINAGGKNIDFDSDKSLDTSTAASGTMGKVLGALKDGEFSFTMNEKGEVGQVIGMREMVRRAVSSLDDANAGAVMSGVSSAFDEENFKQNIEQSFAIYPAKPVKPGESWRSTMTMNNLGMPMKMYNTYTLESVSGDTANVKMNSKISSADGSSTMRTAGAMEGIMKYDIPTGVPVGGDLDMNLILTMNSVPMDMDIKIKITGKKS